MKSKDKECTAADALDDACYKLALVENVLDCAMQTLEHANGMEASDAQGAITAARDLMNEAACEVERTSMQSGGLLASFDSRFILGTANELGIPSGTVRQVLAKADSALALAGRAVY